MFRAPHMAQLPKAFSAFTKVSKTEHQQLQMQQHEKGLREKAAKDTLLQEDLASQAEEEDTPSSTLAPQKRAHRKKTKKLSEVEPASTDAARWDLAQLSAGNKIALQWIVTTADGYYCRICRDVPGASEQKNQAWVSNLALTVT